jgi:excinuclease ABC subunit B
MAEFELISDYEPQGDQPEAIEKLTAGILADLRRQTLLGVTGSGKTFTMANIIARVGKPTLVMAPNKTLAAQLFSEFKRLFPHNSVEYFVSYYDYYQPEAYVPQTDTYIEKDASINEEIDKLRHASTSAILSRDDVIVVASVSCIYGLGSPEEYMGQMVWLRRGESPGLDNVLKQLVGSQYKRNDYNLVRGVFRLRGDVLEIFPSYEEAPFRVEFFGDTIERIMHLDPITGEVLAELDRLAVFPASHYVASPERMEAAAKSIEVELKDRLAVLEREGKLLEAQRLSMRTNYDLEMIREIGFCSGIENYSRHLTGAAPGEPPYTLVDYFPKDLLVVIDESHVSVPQLNGMYAGDRARKQTLVDHGFRLPSALDNRPLRFEEFNAKVPQAVFVSATPGPWEAQVSEQVAEQIIRPTGLVDPEVVVRPMEGQIDDLIHEARLRIDRGERVLVTTLTKKMAEDLTDYLLETGIKVRYLHSGIDTLQRVEILRDLRLGKFDVLVGINLLREGLDLPEVSLVAILDADKEGFLRSERSLIQTMGRAARNVSGQVIMYASIITDSMKRAIDETNRRRVKQTAYNKEYGIEPETVRKAVADLIQASRAGEEPQEYEVGVKAARLAELPRNELERLLQGLEEEMRQAAEELNFEYAAQVRDQIASLKEELDPDKSKGRLK